MGKRKKLPTLLYDRSTGWWFSNIRDASKNCGRAGLKRKYGVGFYIIRHTHATLIGEKSKVLLDS